MRGALLPSGNVQRIGPSAGLVTSAVTATGRLTLADSDKRNVFRGSHQRRHPSCETIHTNASSHWVIQTQPRRGRSMGNLVSRREFLKFTGWRGRGRGGMCQTTPRPRQPPMREAPCCPTKQRPSARRAALAVNQAVTFTFPDASSPCALVKMGTPGAGRRRPQSGHRRLQHHVHAHGLPGRVRQRPEEYSSVPATSACSTRRRRAR